MGVSRGRAWTPEEDDRLRILIGSGWTAREVGADVKRSRNSVISRAQRLHIQFRHGLNAARPDEQPPVLGIPEPEPEPEPVVYTRPPGKDPNLCAVPECRQSRMRQTLYGLCHHHDQERINAKRRAA